MSIRVEYQKDFFKQLGEQLNRENLAMLDEITSTIQADIKVGLTVKNIVNTGHLRDSFLRSIKSSDNKAIGIVGSNVLYSLPMELGITKRWLFPSKKMVNSLIPWVKKKLGITGTPSHIRSVAWLVGRKIARAGLDPSRFPSLVVQNAFIKAGHRIPMLIERHIRRAMALSSRLT